MDHDRYDDSYLRGILQSVRAIAVVGASPNPERPSNEVLGFLGRQGYRIFPINPGNAGGEIHGHRVYATLADVPEPVDMVDVFRNSDAAAAVVDEALRLSPLPKAIWMQLGVRNDAAAARAEAAGVRVVMNRCPKIEIARLGLSRRV
ncbi:MAG TPA: CoA-binding protein [Hyphomicrobiales bacterium]|nr:CoA-binding protein [Hyphomicrobiales bacterium]